LSLYLGEHLISSNPFPQQWHETSPSREAPSIGYSASMNITEQMTFMLKEYMLMMMCTKKLLTSQ
jgi:hypothetical protein